MCIFLTQMSIAKQFAKEEAVRGPMPPKQNDDTKTNAALRRVAEENVSTGLEWRCSCGNVLRVPKDLYQTDMGKARDALVEAADKESLYETRFLKGDHTVTNLSGWAHWKTERLARASAYRRALSGGKGHVNPTRCTCGARFEKIPRWSMLQENVEYACPNCDSIIERKVSWLIRQLDKIKGVDPIGASGERDVT